MLGTDAPLGLELPASTGYHGRHTFLTRNMARSVRLLGGSRSSMELMRVIAKSLGSGRQRDGSHSRRGGVSSVCLFVTRRCVIRVRAPIQSFYCAMMRNRAFRSPTYACPALFQHTRCLLIAMPSGRETSYVVMHAGSLCHKTVPATCDVRTMRLVRVP